MLTLTIEKRDEIDDIINRCKHCFVGMIDEEGLPYVIPMNFGYAHNTIYLHSAPEGGSVQSLKNNPEVCITFCTDQSLVYQHENVACSYRMQGESVICRGKVVFEHDPAEKVKALDILMQQYSDRPFTYSSPAVKNVMIWKVVIERLSAKSFGAPNPKAKKNRG